MSDTEGEATTLPRAAAKGTVSVVWAGALVGAVLIVLFTRGAHADEWLSLVLAACVFGSLCIQLATQEKRGFVRRLAASVSGAVVILAIATGAVALLP